MRLTRYEHDGLTFDVRDEGPLDGEPVVLLHGFPQDSGAWHRVAPLLHGAGLRTLAPDQRGYSPGARPRGRTAYRLSLLVGDVVALIGQAGLDSAHVVGHDWGGGVAWGLGGRASAQVRSLTVLSTPHPAAITAAMLRSDQALRSWYMGVFQLPLVPEVLLRPGLAQLLRRGGLPAEDAAHYAARMSERGALSSALGWYRALPFSLSAPVGRCRVPTTYVWGERDVALGRAAAERTADYVTGDYRFVPLKAGHWLPEKRPTEVAEAVIEQVRLASG